VSGAIVSVNVSEVRSQTYLGKTVTVAVRVPVHGVNLRGDDQADRGNHGGPDRPSYAYAHEDYRWWEKRLSRTLPNLARTSPLRGSISAAR